jgi:hypothetical protein
MPGPVLHVGAMVTCMHAGPVSPVTANARVLVSGMPALLLTDTFPVAGCAFQVPIGTGTKPQPCVTIRWLVGAARVLVGGVPVLLATSPGIGQSAEQIPQGPPTVAGVQPRVIAQ